MATSDSITPSKRCSKKEQCVHPESKDGWLPATTEYFYAGKSYKDGLKTLCRARHCEAIRLRYAENPEKHRKRSRLWKATHPEKDGEYSLRYRRANLDKVRERNRHWERNNLDKARQAKRRYSVQNPEKVREKNRRYRAAHPDKAATNLRNYKARKCAAQGTHTATDIEAQYQLQERRCKYCHCTMTDTPNLPNSRTVDHVIPLSRGGRNDLSNLVIACQHCNFSKGDKLLSEWSATS